MNEFNSESKAGEDIEYDEAPSNEQESERENFCENFGKRYSC